MLIKKGTKVNIIIAPREPDKCAFIKGKLTLLDIPDNPGFKAWIEGETAYWEWGKTREGVKNQMRRRLKAEELELDKFIYQNKSVR